jgi:hypothetical protein
MDTIEIRKGKRGAIITRHGRASYLVQLTSIGRSVRASSFTEATSAQAARKIASHFFKTGDR